MFCINVCDKNAKGFVKKTSCCSGRNRLDPNRGELDAYLKYSESPFRRIDFSARVSVFSLDPVSSGVVTGKLATLKWKRKNFLFF